MKASLFIPVYNASRYIPHALNEAYRSLSEACLEFEIVIVDDNSNDQTGAFLKEIEQAIYPEGKAVRVMPNTTGPSRRENLAAAFQTAKYDVVAFIDADLSCGIEYLTQALKCIERENADVVIGSRYIRGAKVTREPFRRIMSFFYNLTIRILFGSRIHDHQCGLKVFRHAVVEQILKDMGYDHGYHRGWFWDAEFLIRAQKAKLRIIEMPVVWHYASTSTFRFFREWKCVSTMLNLRVALTPWLKRLFGRA